VEIYVEREIADVFDRHRVCVLSRCRRTRNCIGNSPRCWRRAISELPIPGKLQDTIEKAYASIQQERAAAAREGRAPRVLRPVTNYKRRGK
jgi:hypothetical protein